MNKEKFNNYIYGATYKNEDDENKEKAYTRKIEQHNNVLFSRSVNGGRTSSRSMVVNKAARGRGSAEAFREAALDFTATKHQPLPVQLRLYGLVVFGLGCAERSNDGARCAGRDAASGHG